MSSMVQYAYDMGITTSLGGMIRDGFYNDNSSYDNDEYEDNTWYSCNECNWNGKGKELDKDGDCPECGSSVTEDE